MSIYQKKLQSMYPKATMFQQNGKYTILKEPRNSNFELTKYMLCDWQDEEMDAWRRACGNLLFKRI